MRWAGLSGEAAVIPGDGALATDEVLNYESRFRLHLLNYESRPASHLLNYESRYRFHLLNYERHSEMAARWRRGERPGQADSVECAYLVTSRGT